MKLIIRGLFLLAKLIDNNQLCVWNVKLMLRETPDSVFYDRKDAKDESRGADSV